MIRGLSFETATTINIAFVVLVLALFENELWEIRTRLAKPVEFFFGNQYATNSRIIDFIKDEHPKEAKLIEYSSGKVENVIDSLIREQCKVYLLLHSPTDGSINIRQEERICNQIVTHMYSDFMGGDIGYRNIRIRCYKSPGSIRGRNIDNKLINLGWYTYNKKTPGVPFDIWGHTNPHLTIKEDCIDFPEVKDWFNKIFSELWGDSQGLDTICEHCSKSHQFSLCKTSQFHDWIELVSKDDYHKA